MKPEKLPLEGFERRYPERDFCSTREGVKMHTVKVYVKKGGRIRKLDRVITVLGFGDVSLIQPWAAESTPIVQVVAPKPTPIAQTATQAKPVLAQPPDIQNELSYRRRAAEGKTDHGMPHFCAQRSNIRPGHRPGHCR